MRRNLLKKLVGLSLAVLLSSFISLSAQARGEREGFLVGGSVFFGGDVADLDAAGGGIGLRIGAGLNERLLLYFEGDNFFTSKFDEFVDISTALAKAQYFFTDHVFGNLGIGLGFASIKNDTDAGFGMNLGGGYEFRITERFVISPELSFTYAHINDADLFIPAIKGYFGVYF